MRPALWLAGLWPGFAQAWLLGRWKGLALASGFAAALNLAVVATWAWPRWPAELPTGMTAAAAWLLVLGFWSAGLAWLRHDWPRLAAKRPQKADAEVEAWFSDAQTQYLRGHWLEAETLIGRVLARQPGDVEAALLLASIQRRTGRAAEVRHTLQELRENGGAVKWLLEIESELKQLSDSETNKNEIVERVDENQETRRAA